MKQKYYINNELKERQCGNCNVIKPFSEFSIAAGSRPKTQCKVCKSYYNTFKAQEARMIKNPDKYIQCEECFYIRSVIKGSVCPKCKTEVEDDPKLLQYN